MSNEKAVVVQRFAKGFAQLGAAFELLGRACTTLGNAGQALADHYHSLEELEADETARENAQKELAASRKARRQDVI